MPTKTKPLTGHEPAASLSNEEILRYSRHLIMPEVGLQGQLKLKAAKVLLIGTGGLGAPLGLYLTAARVGNIGLVDFDVVDFTNLQRQITFGTSDVGKPKTEAARARLSNLNPDVRITTFETKLTSENALDLFKDYDIIVDGTDNFPTRYLVNDACLLLGKPNVYGSIFRFEGQVTVFGMPDGPCYRCLYPEPPPPGLVPSCAEGGVLGVLPGIAPLPALLSAMLWRLSDIEVFFPPTCSCFSFARSLSWNCLVPSSLDLSGRNLWLQPK
jgi:adenylyltransferase/sulfurtransferase